MQRKTAPKGGISLLPGVSSAALPAVLPLSGTVGPPLVLFVGILGHPGPEHRPVEAGRNVSVHLGKSAVCLPVEVLLRGIAPGLVSDDHVRVGQEQICEEYAPFVPGGGEFVTVGLRPVTGTAGQDHVERVVTRARAVVFESDERDPGVTCGAVEVAAGEYVAVDSHRFIVDPKRYPCQVPPRGAPVTDDGHRCRR